MTEKITKQTTGNETFLYCGGVKVAKIMPDGNIAFHDKNHTRSSQRGSDQVVVPVAELIKVLSPSSPPVNQQATIDPLP